jgi:hypothetical protein
VNERDSALFGVLCNLQGNLAACWASGDVPPAAHLGEFRRLCELFGLAGARSRLTVAAERNEINPCSRNGRRSTDADDLNRRVRAIIERPVAELVEIRLGGGELAACSLLARQYLGRLFLADEREDLQELRDEIDDRL